MLRSLPAILALTIISVGSAFAGDCCNSCGSTQAWGNYGGCDSCGDACADPCNSCSSCRGNGCHRCCFPLLRGAVRSVGKVVNFIIPTPCCRKTACCQPACNTSCNSGCDWNPTQCDSCGSGESMHYSPAPSNPFGDDMHSQMTPTPAMPSHSARVYKKSPVTTRTSSVPVRSMPEPVRKMVPTPAPLPSYKTAAAQPMPKITRGVVKVSHEEKFEEENSAVPFIESAPAAPASVRFFDEPTVSRSKNPLR
jgi:hypothetical protein